MCRPIFMLFTIMLLLAACAQTPAPTPIAVQPTPITASSPMTTTVVVAETPAALATTPAVVTETSVIADAPPTAAVASSPLPALPTLPPSEPGLLPRITMAPITATIPSGFRSEQDGFGSFRLPVVDVQPQLDSTTFASDLADVQISVLLSPAQRGHLAANGFVVTPGTAREFYEIYEQARYNYQPTLITSDALLHIYHLSFDNILRRLERQTLAPMVARLDWELAHTSLQYAEVLAGTPYAEAARRNAAYFAVPVAILYPDWQPPPMIRDIMESDAAHIAAHNDASASAIFPALPDGEDWTQYTPRGHYTTNEALTRYFQAMMWHGRMTFTAQPNDAVNLAIVDQQQLLLTHALRYTKVDGRSAAEIWQGIYDLTTFFVGESRTVSPLELFPALEQAYGDVGNVTQLVDDVRLDQFIARAGDLTGLNLTREFRFMGQRVVPDTDVFRRLVDPDIKGRLTPKSLDFFAVLGSDRALEHLKATGDTELELYAQTVAELRQKFAAYDQKQWTSTLYWTWIYTLQPLLTQPGSGYPAFMRSPAWLDKQLTTALGSWTELKHDTILYAEQVFAEGAGGLLSPPTPELPKGYVEPVPELYARIGALATMTRGGLEQHGVLDDSSARMLNDLAAIADQLQRMAETELRGAALSDDDYTYIRHFGSLLENFTFRAADDTGAEGGIPTGDKPQAPIVTDIATNRSGSVLYQATGYISDIYAIVPSAGHFVVARGGMFSHYEFEEDTGSRLTNEIWRARLAEGKTPARATWTDSFVIEDRVEAPLAETIVRFNDDLAAAFFFGEPSGIYFNFETGGSHGFRQYDLNQYLIGAELQDTLDFIQQMNARNQAIGMRRLSIDFLSFDFVSATTATVATREHWDEKLYGSSIDSSASEEPPVIGRRTYEVNATYTMEQQGDHWVISKITLSPEPPGWTAP